MCNINAWFPGTSKIKQSTLEEYWGFCKDSARSNRDGFGLWTADNIYKWETKRIPSLLAVHKTLARQPFIITHQRLATSGKSKDMMHPYRFYFKDAAKNTYALTGIHNGIMTLPFEYDEKQFSDSYMFFRVLSTELSKVDLTRSISEKLAEILKRILPTITGSYSILMSVGDQMFYFRKNRAITCYVYHGGLYFTTNARPELEKKVTLSKSYTASNEVDIKQETLYQILPNIAELVTVCSLAKPLPVKEKRSSLLHLSKKAVNEVVNEYAGAMALSPDEVTYLNVITEAIVNLKMTTRKRLTDFDPSLLSDWFVNLFYLMDDDSTQATDEEITQNIADYQTANYAMFPPIPKTSDEIYADILRESGRKPFPRWH